MFVSSSPFLRAQRLCFFLLVIGCLIIHSLPALSYKQGEFPGRGNRQTWREANALLNAGIDLDDAGNVEMAIARFKLAITKYPFDPDFYLALGQSYEKRNRAGDMQLAVNSYKQATNIEPGIWQYWNALANPLFRLHKYSEAKDALVEALRLNPPANAVTEIRNSIKQIETKSKTIVR